MSPKVKNKSFPPVKVTEEFLIETQKCAEIADKYLSDYIRKAVEEYNKQYQELLTKEEAKEVLEQLRNDLGASDPEYVGISSPRALQAMINKHNKVKGTPQKQEFKSFFKGGVGK